jgi:hypothetical protein
MRQFYTYRLIGKLTNRFFTTSGVLLAQPDRGFFHYRRTAFSSILQSRVGNILSKAEALPFNLNQDGGVYHI